MNPRSKNEGRALKITMAFAGAVLSLAVLHQTDGSGKRSGDLLDYLARDSYFKKTQRGGGVRELYREISRPQTGIVKKEKKPSRKSSRAAGEGRSKTDSPRYVPERHHPWEEPRTQKQNPREKKTSGNKTVREKPNKEKRVRENSGTADSPGRDRRNRVSPRRTSRSRAARTREARTRGENYSNRKRSVKKRAYEKRKRRGTARKRSRANRRSVSGFPVLLEPTPKKGYRYRAPRFYRGIYLTSATARLPRRYRRILRKAKSLGVNTLVVDVQPRMPRDEFIRFAREEMNMYLVARVVVFQGGLKRYPPPLRHIQRVLTVSEKAARGGFMEIQLDYIRFADPWRRNRKHPRLRLSLKKRYRLIEGILKMSTDRLRPMGVRVGGDIFGRIAFNYNDAIGQRVELFAAHLDTIYPMLYPSHFYGDPHRIRDPYGTILDGSKNCIRRSKGQSRIITYIQGFRMNVRSSGLSYTRYIQKQIQATEDARGAGYVVWNARNNYRAFFRAIQLNERIKKRRATSRKRARFNGG